MSQEPAEVVALSERIADYACEMMAVPVAAWQIEADTLRATIRSLRSRLGNRTRELRTAKARLSRAVQLVDYKSGVIVRAEEQAAQNRRLAVEQAIAFGEAQDAEAEQRRTRESQMARFMRLLAIGAAAGGGVVGLIVGLVAR